MKGLKKHYLLFAIICVCSSTAVFADDIDIPAGTTATCNFDTLGATSGDVSLEATFQPNNISLRWYDFNTLLSVGTAASSCDYDSEMNVPAQNVVSRPGYSLTGWTVRPTYNFASFANTTNGTRRWGRGYNGTEDTCWYNGSSNVCGSGFADLQRYEWKVYFSHGTVYGMGLCSTTSGTANNIGTPNETSQGKYCWCKATAYKRSADNIKYAPSGNLPWVMVYTSSDKAGCLNYCSRTCSNYVESYTGYRYNMFREPAQ